MSASAPPKVFAVLNGKYKYAALHDLINIPGVEVRLSIASGHPLDPYYLPLLAAGAVVYSGDDVENMYTGADVVISYTASQNGMVMQLNHIRRAKEAGVKLFIPCDYALEFASQETSAHDKGKVYTNEDMESERYGGLVVEVYAAPHDPLATHFQSPLVKLRREAVDLCKELGLPCLQVFLGIVPENFLVEEARHPYIDEASTYGWYLNEKKVTILGSGDVPITFTPKEYYRAWFTHLITTTPLSKLQSMGAIYLAAETLTQNQIVKMWEEKHGEKLSVTHVTGKELEALEKKQETERVHNYWSQWPMFIQLECANGRGKLSKPTTETNYSGPVVKVIDTL